MAVRTKALAFGILALMSGGANCIEFDEETKEVCREIAKGDPVRYRECAARMQALPQANFDWSTKCYGLEAQRIQEAAKKRGLSIDEVPDEARKARFAKAMRLTEALAKPKSSKR